VELWRVVGGALGLPLPPRAKIFAEPSDRPPVVLIHTGARSPLRVWPLTHFREITTRLRKKNLKVQIACDPDQINWWRSQGEAAICPQSVSELLTAIDNTGVFIGNDSGPGHLAAACGRPTFTLFGPQLHEWFIPLHPASEVLEGKACPYKPCSDYCRFPKPFCLQDVTVDEVWPRIEMFVARHLGEIKNQTLPT
jgi:ADP-heptose:LPS heptosyltransferase